MAWVRARLCKLQKKGALVYTTKTGRHDIAEILNVITRPPLTPFKRYGSANVRDITNLQISIVT
jgi:uncharacterized protein YggT (Ycf19 family)